MFLTRTKLRNQIKIWETILPHYKRKKYSGTFRSNACKLELAKANLHQEVNTTDLVQIKLKDKYIISVDFFIIIMTQKRQDFIRQVARNIQLNKSLEQISIPPDFLPRRK